MLLIDPEDAVLVRVDGHRAAVLVEIPAQGPHVGFGGLGLGKTQRHQPTGGVVDEHDQRAAPPPILEPRVGRTVDLHQLAQRRPPLAALMDPRATALPAPPQPLRHHPLAQRLHRHPVAMDLRQLLLCQGRRKVLIPLPYHRHHLSPRLRCYGIARPPAPVPRDQPPHPPHTAAPAASLAARRSPIAPLPPTAQAASPIPPVSPPVGLPLSCSAPLRSLTIPCPPLPLFLRGHFSFAALR